MYDIISCTILKCIHFYVNVFKVLSFLTMMFMLYFRWKRLRRMRAEHLKVRCSFVCTSVSSVAVLLIVVDIFTVWMMMHLMKLRYFFCMWFVPCVLTVWHIAANEQYLCYAALRIIKHFATLSFKSLALSENKFSARELDVCVQR